MSTFVEAISSSIARMVARNAVRWFAKIFGFLGITFTTFNLFTNPILEAAEDSWALFGGDLAEWIGALGIDVAVTIILSAYTISFLFGLGARKASAS